MHRKFKINGDLERNNEFVSQGQGRVWMSFLKIIKLIFKM